MSGRVLRWVPALAWAAAVFWASAQPRLVELPWVLSWDKLQHCGAYAVGGAAIAHALGGRMPWLGVALGVLYGASDEFHQWFVPGRNSDARDWVADALGVVAGVFLYRSFLSWRARRTDAGARAQAARP
ncbi:MAG TPA: VanZ family protein [Longimicrobium sp.]|nr:VanZ family protein [Longimicrobium sp.]